jgi:hypothetical protein
MLLITTLAVLAGGTAGIPYQAAGPGSRRAEPAGYPGAGSRDRHQTPAAIRRTRSTEPCNTQTWTS